MELYAFDLHFIGDSPKAQNYDCCVHGKVVFKIDGCNLSNDDSNWCVSALPDQRVFDIGGLQHEYQIS